MQHGQSVRCLSFLPAAAFLPGALLSAALLAFAAAFFLSGALLSGALLSAALLSAALLAFPSRFFIAVFAAAVLLGGRRFSEASLTSIVARISDGIGDTGLASGNDLERLDHLTRLRSFALVRRTFLQVYRLRAFLGFSVIRRGVGVIAALEGVQAVAGFVVVAQHAANRLFTLAAAFGARRRLGELGDSFFDK